MRVWWDYNSDGDYADPFDHVESNIRYYSWSDGCPNTASWEYTDTQCPGATGSWVAKQKLHFWYISRVNGNPVWPPYGTPDWISPNVSIYAEFSCATGNDPLNLGILG